MRAPTILALLTTVLVWVGCGSGDGSGNGNQNRNDNQAVVICGDGVVGGAEECDDGTLNSDSTPDACRTDCLAARCGDGIVDTGELCDEGAANSDDPGSTCRLNCGPATCGDGVIDPGEQCDDGPANSGCQPDACRPNCALPICGDGVIDPGSGEVCDGSPGECTDCTADCFDCDGDGYGDGGGCLGDDCDDANRAIHVDCDLLCNAANCAQGCCVGATCRAWADQSESECGSNGAACMPCGGVELCSASGACQPIVCGDGVAQGTEECDDGNIRSHDGCSSGCTLELLEWREQTPASSPPARFDHGLAYDPGRGALVTVSGQDGAGLLLDTWEYDGASWTEITTTGTINGPAKPAAYDSLRQVVVVYPNHWSFPSATREYDGLDWTAISTAGFPGLRPAARLAFDAGRGVSVMVSGNNLDETWEYDGTDWIVISPTALGGRNYYAIDFDSVRSRIVLFGGNDGANIRDDTWSYDGVAWTQVVTVVSPPPRHLVAGAYDANRDRFVIFGGLEAVNQFADTWEFDGTDWVETTPAVSPETRTEHSMAYDSIRRLIVLFGGQSGFGVALGDTWEYGFTSSWPDEICANGSDDDSDGAVDCADPDCAGAPGC